MTRHSGPHFRVPPDDQRCEALVRGHPSWNFEWMRHDHRCPRRAVQMRDFCGVCATHARSKNFLRFAGEPGAVG